MINWFMKENILIYFSLLYCMERKKENGTYYYPDGAKYEGEFVRNKKEGNGTFYWDDQTRWEGTWVNNKMDGIGTYYNGNESKSLTYEKGKEVE